MGAWNDLVDPVDAAGQPQDLLLRTVLVAGLAVWTVSAIATEALLRLELDPFRPDPSRASIVAQVVSTLAFRTWVAALVFLLLRRMPLRRTAPSSSLGEDG